MINISKNDQSKFFYIALLLVAFLFTQGIGNLFAKTKVHSTMKIEKDIKSGKLSLVFVPKEGYEVNHEFPWRLNAKLGEKNFEGVTLDKEKNSFEASFKKDSKETLSYKARIGVCNKDKTICKVDKYSGEIKLSEVLKK